MRVLALLALLVPAAARAVVVEPEDGPCPMGDGFARVFHMVSQNTHGGWDSDGARYSSGGQWRTYAISTCTENLLSLYGRDMPQPLSEADQRKLGPVLEKIRAEVPDPRALRVWDRYVHAARAYEAIGRDGLFLARVYVEASWTVRDDAVGYTERMDGPIAARIVLEAGPAELEKATDPDTERLIVLNLARVAHRGGYIEERDRWMEVLDGISDLSEAHREGLADLKRAKELEPELQDQAIAHLRAWLKGKHGTSEERVEGTYLLADLLRRRGQPAEALAWYAAVEQTPDAPDALVNLSKYLAAELRGEQPWVGMAPGDLTEMPP